MNTPRDFYIVVSFVLVMLAYLIYAAITDHAKKTEAYTVGKFVLPDSVGK